MVKISDGKIRTFVGGCGCVGVRASELAISLGIFVSCNFLFFLLNNFFCLVNLVLTNDKCLLPQRLGADRHHATSFPCDA